MIAIGELSIELLLQVILINLVLSGDNALLIAMAVRNVPKELQKRAIFWGTTGAIVLRLVFAVLIVLLLKIPFLMLIGGLMLVHISYKLIANDEGGHSFVIGGRTLSSAIRTIIIADAIMSLDNVLAIAGIANSLGPIFIGVLISVPMIIWGSHFIIMLMEKAPIILFLGAGLLAWTAGEMIIKERFIASFIHGTVFGPIISGSITVVVLIMGYLHRRKTLAS